MNTPIACAVLLAGTTLAWSAHAQDDFVHRWETSIGVHGIGSNTIHFNGGSTIDVDHDIGVGLEFGYNFSPQWNLALAFDSHDPNYHATIVAADPSDEPDRFRGSVGLSSIMLNGRYNFVLNSRVTPFVSAGVGYVHVDTDVPSGPALAGCWWDPWWGYECDYFVPTRQEDDFAYQGSVGATWRFNPTMFLRGAVGRQWTNVSHANGNPHVDTWKLDIGFNLW